MTKSLSLACAPVPLTGESSRTWPASARTFSAFALSSSAKVLISATTSFFPLTAAISPMTCWSAFGDGRLVIIAGTDCAIAVTFGAISTPACDNSAASAGSTSHPFTCQPAAARLRANAPPMMPGPIIPTAPFLILLMSNFPCGIVTLNKGFRHALRQRHLERIDRHGDQAIVAQDCNKFDQGFLAE